MTSVLPVRVAFRLPEGWVAVDPEQVDAPGAAFVAVHRPSQQPGFTANLTMQGEYRPDVELSVLADEAVNRMRASGWSVRVQNRRPVRAGGSRALAQSLCVDATVRGAAVTVIQDQVFLDFRDVDGRHHGVHQHALTALPGEQLAAVRPGFAEFLASIRPESA